MALMKCRECGKRVSKRAAACPGCGAPHKRASSLGSVLKLALLGLIIAGVVGAARNAGASRTTRVGDPPTAGTRGAQPPKTVASTDDLAYPFKLVTMLSRPADFSGAECWLRAEQGGWHKSKFDGTWNAVLRRSFGENEVSCLLESSMASSVERVELEAEFYRPGEHESAMLLQFSQSAQILMYPTVPTREFAEAVVQKTGWSDGKWELVRTPYPNTAGGFGLMLRRVTNR